MASALELLTLARHTAFPPRAVWTDTTYISSGNVTAAVPITKAWTGLASAPAAGTLYTVETEFVGTAEGHSILFSAGIGGTYHGFSPEVAAGAWAAGTNVAGWLKLTVRVTSATACTIVLAGAISEDSANYTPGTGGPPLVTVPLTGIAIAASDTIEIGVQFGASAAGQGIDTYGSTFTIAGAPW